MDEKENMIEKDDQIQDSNIKEKPIKNKVAEQKLEDNTSKAKHDKIKEKLSALLENNITTVVMTLITIYALFGDDVRVLSTDKHGDPVFWILNIIAMVFFTIEIVISCLIKKDYFLGFFFWLDTISTLSLFLDIGWVSNKLFQSQSASSAKSAAQLARAGRASRVGTKAGRIVRIIRLIRLVKLYKHAQQALETEATNLEKCQSDGQKNQSVDQEKSQGISQINSPNIGGNQEQSRNPKVQSPIQGQLIKIHSQSNQNLDGKPNKSIELNNTLQVQKGIHNKIRSSINAKEIITAKIPVNDKEAGLLNDKQQQEWTERQILKQQEDQPTVSQPRGGGGEEEDKLKRLLNNNNNIRVASLHSKKQSMILVNKMREKKAQNIKSSSQSAQQDTTKTKQVKELDLPKETKVGQVLSDLTTKRVIALVMSIMLSIPLFDITTYRTQTTSLDHGLAEIVAFNSETAQMTKIMDYFIGQHQNIRSPIVHIEFKNVVTDSCCTTFPNPSVFSYGVVDYQDLRQADQLMSSINDGSGNTLGYSIADDRKNNRLDSILSIIRTIFISFILGGGAMLFSNDVEDLVVSPIESMLIKVQRIASNPQEAAQIEEKEALVLEQLEKSGKVQELIKKKNEEKYETVILEKLIVKIGALLSVGFGEAGSEIIAENISHGGEVDPLLPGKKIIAIFGFCDIRNFTDATEVLQTDVMVFVNEIAEIVHGMVDRFCGQANKNIGDAFLLVWKFNENDSTKNENGEIELKDEARISHISDLPVVSFLKIQAALYLSKKLDKYRKNKELNQRMPNYTPKMGFGLHLGWGIEGAIGSNYKIDASYLSPNVNMASRLEAATKQFGTSLLISGQLYNRVSQQLKTQFRQIDKVTVKGSVQPLDLYTVDVSTSNLLKKISKHDKFNKQNLSQAASKKKRVLERIERKRLRTSIEENKKVIYSQFQEDQELVAMREIFTKEFYEKWKVGFAFYLKGEWSQAKTIFEETKSLIPTYMDGPSMTLLSVIEESNGKAPSNWPGYRVLVDK